jgi:hypothetical protein
LDPVTVAGVTIADFDHFFISTFGRKAAVVTNVTTAAFDHMFLYRFLF